MLNDHNRKPSTSEKFITRRIREYLLKLPGTWVMKIHGGKHQLSGMPDLLCIAAPQQEEDTHGMVIWFEVKTPGGKCTKNQHAMIKKMRELGCIAEVVRSLEDVVDILVKLEWHDPKIVRKLAKGYSSHRSFGRKDSDP